MVTITILSVIMVISLATFRGIKNKTVKKDYDNLKLLIETKAENHRGH